jgi:galactokinase
VAGLACRATERAGLVEIEDARWHGYLANITPAEFERAYVHHLPAEMAGAEFLARYGGITDEVTTVAPERSYPVRAATAHPIYEHTRVTEFAALLRDWQGQEGARLGALMYESHASYGACGLGAAATDELVELVRAAVPAQGLYGAKITGGGSGGTVAVLGRREAGAAVAAIAAEYARRAGRAATVIGGSSDGAWRFGHLLLTEQAHDARADS